MRYMVVVFEPTGAVAAAATAGLPEVLGGKRNYDCRHSWLRDTAKVVRAMPAGSPLGRRQPVSDTDVSPNFRHHEWPAAHGACRDKRGPGTFHRCTKRGLRRGSI